MNAKQPIVVEETYNVRADEVWNALTEQPKMIQWYFDNIPEFEAVVGFKTQFNVESNGRDFLHLWEVTDAIPNKIIGYRWEYANYAGKGHVNFELSEKRNRTNLKLTASGIDSFPQHIAEFKRESCEDGWKYFIKLRLKEYLEP